MFELIDFIIFFQIYAYSKFEGSNMFQKSWNRCKFYFYFLLCKTQDSIKDIITLCKRLQMSA